MAWLTTKDGRHFNTDWIDKERQIAENKRQADERNDISISKDNVSNFGKSGTYTAYRSGDIFDSPMGYLSFGLEESQSYLYAEESGKPIEKYDIQIKNPYVLTGNDFDKMQDVIAKKFAGESYLDKSTVEEMRKVQKHAAEEMEKQGYDAILMDKKNNITGKHQYEINLLNKYKKNANRKGN